MGRVGGLGGWCVTHRSLATGKKPRRSKKSATKMFSSKPTSPVAIDGAIRALIGEQWLPTGGGQREGKWWRQGGKSRRERARQMSRYAPVYERD